jgi:hypothetical protein
MKILRYVFLLFFPNVTVKRGLYNMKIRQNTYCINSLNNILKSKSNSFIRFKRKLVLFRGWIYPSFNCHHACLQWCELH